MTKRSLSVVALSLITLGSLVGCQSAPPAAMAYPAPSFEAPKMVSAEPVAPLPAAVLNYPVLPKRVAIAPPKTVTPLPMAGIPLAWVPPVAPRAWRWIVVHHSDTTTGGAAAFDKMHREKGWDELGYDFVIGNGTDTGNGQIEVGSRWTKQKIGAHAKTPDNRFNEYGIGICLVGNFMEERPTAEQMKSLDKLVAYLMVTYHITPDNIIGHRDTKATDCPGKYMNLAIVRRQAALLAGTTFAARKTSASVEMLTDIPGSN